MNNKSPRVSVVTPSYNAMPFLKETIESIIMQNHENVQHIIMDGGSVDGTRELLASYPGLVWKSERDKGQSDALNKAFALAEGDIIGWLNADDTYATGAMKEAIEFFATHPEIDMVHADLNIINEKSEVIGLTRGGDFDPVRLLSFNPIKQPTAFMRKRVLEKLKGVDVQYHYVMDREFWLRFGMAGFKSQYLPGKIWANFRMCEGTKSFEHTPRFRDEWYQVIRKAMKEPFFQNIPEKEIKAALSENRFSYHLALMLEAGASGNRLDVVKHFYKAASYMPRQLFRAGFIKHLFTGMLKLQNDKLRKFKKLKGQVNL